MENLLLLKPMHSSTKIINEETNFLSEKLKDYLKNIAKENLKKISSIN